MPAHDALRAATGTAADVLGCAGRTGRIAPGLQADLLVVDDDPREDVRVLLDPFLILRAGRSPSKEGQSEWLARAAAST
jgi:imidazolonepropionase-like amidohydrolase